jgi:phospholipase D
MKRTFAATLIVFAAWPALAAELPPIYTTGDATVCFTTGNKSTIGGDCAAVLVAEIAKAERELLGQAYNFTEPRIIEAIIAAHRRGVLVTVILDKISPSQKGEGFIDRKPKIAHSKVVIIDQTTVITGSFNFSTNAGCCNAENLLVIHRQALAVAYAENFARRRAVSVEYVNHR